MHNVALLTDLYELTMMAGYLKQGMQDESASFDLFFRQSPFNGGYTVFAGLGPVLDYLEGLRFTQDDIAYLAGLSIFPSSFLGYLEKFRFRGKVTAPAEGTIVFPNEPLLTVEGSLAEAQFVETMLLNIVNFQSLAATKAARISHAAGNAEVIEFGLRRAQGPDGGLSVARAAFIGGIASTSNVFAGKIFDIPVKGTHAHSWVMAFPDELSAFRAYAETFPDRCVFLVDTYDTISSGIPNAITVGKELGAKGHRLGGIRLDSGDLAWLSKLARRMLDDAGLHDTKIVASNELDEFVIESIRSQGGCIDIYGVGTRLATCAGDGGGALGGVYKLVKAAGLPRLKITGDVTKGTLPDTKRVFRGTDTAGRFIQDVISLEGELPRPGDLVYDPVNPLLHMHLPEGIIFHDLRQVIMEGGQRLAPSPSLCESSAHRREQIRCLPDECHRLMNPHRYKVSITQALHGLRNRLMEEHTAAGPSSD